MKIQCPCGAKYEFQLTPEMAKGPIRFVCSQCGLDASEFVGQLVRQELGASPPKGVPLAVAAPAPTSPAPPAARIRVQTAAEPAKAAEAETAEAPQNCHRHPDQVVVAQCYVCSKPL